MNFSIVIWILAVLVLVFVGVTRFVGSNEQVMTDQPSATAAANTAPVGQVSLAGEPLPIEEAMEDETVVSTKVTGEAKDPGKQVYSTLCFSCHGTGLPGIPQLGDKAAWVDRIAQGKGVLYERALTGFTSGTSGMPMPAKGGNMNLSDDEVKAAVDYMVASAE